MSDVSKMIEAVRRTIADEINDPRSAVEGGDWRRGMIQAGICAEQALAAMEVKEPPKRAFRPEGERRSSGFMEALKQRSKP